MKLSPSKCSSTVLAVRELTAERRMWNVWIGHEITMTNAVMHKGAATFGGMSYNLALHRYASKEHNSEKQCPSRALGCTFRNRTERLPHFIPLGTHRGRGGRRRRPLRLCVCCRVPKTGAFSCPLGAVHRNPAHRFQSTPPSRTTPRTECTTRADHHTQL